MSLNVVEPYGERVSLSANSRPQYYYVYGSVEEDDHVEPDYHDHQFEDPLFGEELVPTDHEDEVPSHGDLDVPHVVITNEKYPTRRSATLLWPYQVGLVPISLLIVTVVILILIMLPTESEPMRAYGSVPFSHIDRSDFGDSVEDIVSMDLFHPTLISESKPRAFKFPFPTGAFWTNLVLPAGKDGLSLPIAVYPYACKWGEGSLQLSYPAAHREVSSAGIHDIYKPDITIAMEEESRNRYVTKFDPLSVTLRFVSTAESKWETSLVQGSPYSTLKVLSSTPVFRALTSFRSVQCPGDDKERFNDFTEDDDEDEGGRRRLFGVCRIDESDDIVTTIRGVQFIFETAEGLSWIMFSSEPMVLEVDTAQQTTIKSSSKFTGIIRLALIPKNSPNEKTTDTDSSTGLRRLIYHAGVYPTGCHVSWDFHSQSSSNLGSASLGDGIVNKGRQATVTFAFSVQTMLDTTHLPSEAAKKLLMLALPHHAEKLPLNDLLEVKKFDLTFRCIKGSMTPVVGSTWAYTESLLDIALDGPLKEVDQNIHEMLLEQIDDDMSQLLPMTAENIYGFGKQIARLAQLTHIAKRIQRDGEHGNGFLTGIPEKGTALLSNYLEMFLNSQVTDKLLFDANLGGLVSSNGLKNTEEDFGNGRYNNHHFHYGYILYACAIMGKLDPSFMDRFGPNVDAIFHDVAHPLNGDNTEVQPSSLFFPLARHKSWFDGHSYASGLFPLATGKWQESSSESINCYFGAYAWSLVRHSNAHVDSDMTDFARLLLSMEIRSTQKYWQMIPPSALGVPGSAGVYSPEFEEQYMVGNVGMLDVSAQTWLGDEPLQVHMNNILPVTAVTAAIFDKEYVRYQYPYLMQECGDELEMTYKGYAVILHAIIDPTEAWKEAKDLNSWELETSLSKSEVIYWITQRPGFSNISLDFDE